MTVHRLTLTVSCRVKSIWLGLSDKKMQICWQSMSLHHYLSFQLGWLRDDSMPSNIESIMCRTLTLNLKAFKFEMFLLNSFSGKMVWQKKKCIYKHEKIFCFCFIKHLDNNHDITYFIKTLGTSNQWWKSQTMADVMFGRGKHKYDNMFGYTSGGL